MDLTRLPNPTAEDEERIKKYIRAAERIDEVLPCADSIPDRHLISVDGVVGVQPCISHDQFSDMFIRFVEAHGWFFGGGYKDITAEEDSVQSDKYKS